MRIGVNTRFLLPGKMEGFGWYTYEVVSRMVAQHPEHEFIFFFDRPYDPKFIFGKNVTPVVLFPPARHPFLFIWWFDFSIKKALEKYQVDVFFSPDGYMSLRSDVPQVGVIHDINYEHFPQDVPKMARWYLQRYFPKFARKATAILTVSDYSKQDLIKTYQLPWEKITVAWNGASELFRAVDEAEKQKIRDQYAGGSEFFLFVGAIHPRKNVKRLIEAYSLFKKQTSLPVELVIVGESLWKNAAFQLEIPPKIKDSIHFTGHLPIEQLTKITGSALALTYVPYFEGFGIPIAEAMKCGTPVLAGNLTSLPEVAGDAAIYCDPFSVETITSGMKQLAESPELRAKLGKLGKERSALFSWDHTASIAWNTLLKASGNNE